MSEFRAMNTQRIITIDGPAGVGKSTLAKRVAGALGIAYLDTGAMFRTVALRAGEDGFILPEHQVEALLHHLAFSLSGSGNDTALACNGTPVGAEIRTESVGMLASRYATMPVVRAWLKTAQQELGRLYSLVAEGRDMGSVVFPDAPYKFFLDAAPQIRAARRVEQLAALGVVEDVDVVTEQIRARDTLDRGRAIAPLRAAKDAVVIDTSHLDIDGVFAAIMRHIV